MCLGIMVSMLIPIIIYKIINPNHEYDEYDEFEKDLSNIKLYDYSKLAERVQVILEKSDFTLQELDIIKGIILSKGHTYEL